MRQALEFSQDGFWIMENVTDWIEIYRLVNDPFESIHITLQYIILTTISECF